MSSSNVPKSPATGPSAPVSRPTPAVPPRDDPSGPRPPPTALAGAAPTSRRAQGWHSAVDGAAGPRTGSILSTDTSRMGRQHSVQFSEDALASRPSARAAHREDVGFLQNMVDFLGVMYGGKAEGPGAAAGPRTTTTTTTPTGSGGTPPRARASMYRSAATAPQAQPPSPTAVAGKGPQVRGRTTTPAAHPVASAPSGRLGGSGGADRIDVLVDHLVRAYSSRVGAGGSGRGLVMDDGAEEPVSYNGSARRGPLTGRRRAWDANEVSTFVSQALDGFLGPSSGRAGHQLTSTKSILSSLGLDENFANLLSFRTRSGIPDGADAAETESMTQLQPVHIGEQAMFRSVGSHPADQSVSKSMGVVWTGPPTSGAGADGPGQPSPAVKTEMGRSPAALSATRAGPGPQTGRRTATAAAPSAVSQDRSFTLDSRALLSADGGADDSWGDVDAEAAKLAAKEREKERRKAAAAAAASGSAQASPLVNNTRSLLELAKDRQVVQDLLEEEALSRNVVLALEQQLRSYIVSTLTETRGAPSVRGRRKPGGDVAASTAATAVRR